MAVYVDDMQASFGRMKICHMVADTTEELLAMADRIGVAREHLRHAGTHLEHFDIALSQKRRALRHGAKAITWGAAAALVAQKRAALLRAMETQQNEEAV